MHESLPVCAHWHGLLQNDIPQVPVSPKEITSVEVLSQTMLIHTAEKTYQVDFTAPLSPEVSVRV